MDAPAEDICKEGSFGNAPNWLVDGAALCGLRHGNPRLAQTSTSAANASEAYQPATTPWSAFAEGVWAGLESVDGCNTSCGTPADRSAARSCSTSLARDAAGLRPVCDTTNPVHTSASEVEAAGALEAAVALGAAEGASVEELSERNRRRARRAAGSVEGDALKMHLPGGVHGRGPSERWRRCRREEHTQTWATGLLRCSEPTESRTQRCTNVLRASGQAPVPFALDVGLCHARHEQRGDLAPLSEGLVM